MDIVERLREKNRTITSDEVFADRFEAANEIESLYAEIDMAEVRIYLLRGWLRHIGYYVSRSEPNLSPTEKYIQEICAEALNLELEDVRKEPYSGGISEQENVG